MSTVNAIPPLPDRVDRGPFTQRVELIEAGRVIGSAGWAVTDLTDGVVQILDLSIHTPHRRRGFGKQLLQAVIGQAMQYCDDRGCTLRRLWIAVGHKTEIVGRSFAGGNGFHHVSSIGGIYASQDLLLYVRSMD